MVALVQTADVPWHACDLPSELTAPVPQGLKFREIERLGLHYHFPLRDFGRMVARRLVTKERFCEAFADTQLRRFVPRLLQVCSSLRGFVRPSPAVHFRLSVQKAVSELLP